MARKSTNEYGLTAQQEKFCIFYINEYANIGDDGDDSDVALAAYRKAYNCQNDAKEKSHRESASRLKNSIKIQSRIRELRNSISQAVGIECADIVSRNVRALNIDPLRLLIYDRKIGKYRLRFMHELPKDIRDVIPYKINGRGIVVPDIDRNRIMDRLIRILGFEAPKDVNLHGTGTNLGTEIRIGFDD